MLLLRLEFGVIVLHLSSNKVNGLLNNVLGRAGRISIRSLCDEYEFLGLLFNFFSKYMTFYISQYSFLYSTYLVYIIAFFHKSKESIR